jgi:hypothetical protein
MSFLEGYTRGQAKLTFQRQQIAELSWKLQTMGHISSERKGRKEKAEVTGSPSELEGRRIVPRTNMSM